MLGVRENIFFAFVVSKIELEITVPRDFDAPPESTCNAQRRDANHHVDRARTFRSIFARNIEGDVSVIALAYGIISKDRDRYDFGEFNFDAAEARK